MNRNRFVSFGCQVTDEFVEFYNIRGILLRDGRTSPFIREEGAELLAEYCGLESQLSSLFVPHNEIRCIICLLHEANLQGEDALHEYALARYYAAYIEVRLSRSRSWSRDARDCSSLVIHNLQIGRSLTKWGARGLTILLLRKRTYKLPYLNDMQIGGAQHFYVSLGTLLMAIIMNRNHCDIWLASYVYLSCFALCSGSVTLMLVIQMPSQVIPHLKHPSARQH